MDRTCKTCKWWGDEDNFNGDRSCSNTAFCEDDSNRGHDRARTDQCVYCYSEGGGMDTGPDFGCIHHKEKP